MVCTGHIIIMFVFIVLLITLVPQTTEASYDCGAPDRPYSGKVDYNSTTVNSTAVFTCKAGYSMSSPGYRVAVCNESSVWEMVEGSDSIYCTEILKHVGCMTLTNETVLVQTPAIHEDLPKDNLNECIRACKNLTYLFATRQGEHCYCTSSIDGHEIASNCDDLCHDEFSYCGSSPGIYSVFITFDKCIDIKNTSLLPTPMTQVRTGLTCIQLCLAQDTVLSFYKHAKEECFCLDGIPEHDWAPYGCGNIAVNENKTFDYQALEVTALSTRYTSCENLYNNGIFYHGLYLLQNGTKINCHFYDSSTTCPTDWIAYQGSCYLFRTTFTNATEHFKMCRRDNSQMMTIRNADDMAFMRIFSQNLVPAHSEDFYVGLFDIQTEFTYMWSDETRVAYRPFMAGYPLNLEASCIQWASEGNAMKNVLCDSVAYGICERREVIPGCRQVPDLDLGVPSTNSTSMSTPLCFETCRSQGQTYSATRNTFCFCYTEVSNFTEVSWDHCDTPCPVHPFQICGGSAENTVFVTKDIGQPLRSGCNEMILEGLVTNVTFQVSDVANASEPTETNDCREEAGEKCQEFWLEIDDHCYRYFRESTASPFKSCLAFGGYVAVFETSQEQARVLQIIRDFPSIDTATSHWMFGLRYIRGDSSFLRYSNGAWLNASTDEALPDVDVQCVALRSNGQVLDSPVDCTKNAFICEKDDDFKGCCVYSERPGDVIVIDSYPEMTVRVCMEACKPTGFPYAGIILGNTCVCTSEYQQASNGTVCDMFCADFQGCGSKEPGYVSVYTVDYRHNASSCEELYYQGVLLNGLYTLGDGVKTWCGMKDSSYLASYAQTCNASQGCDFTRHFVGVNESVYSVDITAAVSHPYLSASCKDIFTPASIAANVKEKWTTDLVTDTLRWLLEVPSSIPTFIGAVDEFNMGIFTWSDGDIFRMSDLAMTQPLTYWQDRSLHLTMNQAGNVSEASVDTRAKYHVTCQRDISFKGCYRAPNGSSLAQYESVSSYRSISLGLCRQVCQARNMSRFLVSTSSCICDDPDPTGHSTIISQLASSNDADCDVSCPASRLQRCGSPPYFRLYTFEQDHVSSCQELYDNFIVYNATYIINGKLTTCGLDDTTASCGPGFISWKSKCYRFQRRSDLALTQAADQCRALSSYLASPATDQERTDIEYLIKQFTELRTAELWFMGFYRTFIPGFYSSASGNMHLGDVVPTPSGFEQGVRAVALNISSSNFESVAAASKYPFVCESSDVMRGSGDVLSDDAVFEFALPGAMSVHQCAASCRGSGLNVTLAAIRGQTCRCVKEEKNVSWSYAGATQFCPGHPLQICGGASADEFTVYDLVFFPNEHLHHSCDQLFSFGVVLPSQYITDTSELVQCFRLSSRTDYVMANASSSVFNTSGVASGDPRLRVDSLVIGGWHGVPDDPMYVQVDLGDYYVMEGLIIMDPSNSGNALSHVTLSISLEGQYYQDSDHGDIAFGPNTNLVWLTLSTPLVCRIVRLTFTGTSLSSTPSVSFEILGYLYVTHPFENHYLGCHALTGNEIITNFTPLQTEYNMCRQACANAGYSTMILEDSDTCRCLRTNDTRDLYNNGHCAGTCFNTTDLPCESGNDTRYYYSSYLVKDFECQEFSINNTNVTETTVVSSPVINVTTATSWTISCQKGFKFNQSASSSVSTQCYNFGIWVPLISSYECVRVDCGNPPSASDSSINTTVTGTLYGHTIGYACNGGPGWAFDGQHDQFEVTCQEDEEWTPAIPPCSLKVCNATPSVELASLHNSTSQHVYGDNITYVCNDGCHFEQDNETAKTIRCLATGQWEDIEPKCTRFRCPAHPPALNHTQVIVDSASESARYVCDSGAEFEGRSIEQNITCNQTTFLWTSVVACKPVVYLSGYGCPTYLDKRLDDQSVYEVTSRSLMDCAVKCLNARLCYKFSHPKLDSSDVSSRTNSTKCLLSFDGNTQDPGFADDDEWNTYILSDDC